MNMKIKTVTPLHVGSGGEYTSSEFYFASMNKKTVLVRADVTKLFPQLSDEDKDNFIIELEDPQFTVQNFIKKLRENNTSVDTSKIRLYSAYLKSKDVEVSRREVREHVKTSHKAYIPGSSIKGALKTAILYDMVNSDDIRQMNRMFNRGHDNRVRLNSRESQRFQDKFFSSDPRKAPNSSIMRFLQISDTSPVPYMSIHTVASVKATRMGWELYQRRGNQVKTTLETIDKENELNCQFNITDKDEIIKKLDAEYLREYLDRDHLLACMYHFSDDLIQNEINFAEKYNVDSLEDFYYGIQSRNTPKNPLLNIGQGTGFLGTTIGLKIKDTEPEIFDMVRESTRGRTYPDEFPKTRKIVLEGNVPLGWVQVELK